MATRSFFEILQAARSATDLKASPPLPAGLYELEITKADPKAELRFDFGDYPEGTQCIEVFFRPVEALEVDEDALAEVDDWKTKVVSQRFVSAEDVAKFADSLSKRGLVYDAGLDPEDYFDDNGINLEDLCRDLSKRHLLGTITHSPNKKNPDSPYVNLKRTAPLD